MGESVGKEAGANIDEAVWLPSSLFPRFLPNPCLVLHQPGHSGIQSAAVATASLDPIIQHLKHERNSLTCYI